MLKKKDSNGAESSQPSESLSAGRVTRVIKGRFIGVSEKQQQLGQRNDDPTTTKNNKLKKKKSDTRWLARATRNETSFLSLSSSIEFLARGIL